MSGPTDGVIAPHTLPGVRPVHLRVYAALRTPTSPREGGLWCPAEPRHRVPGCVRRGQPCAPLGVLSHVPAGASLMDTKKDDSKGQAPRRTAQLVRGKREPPLPHGCPGCPPAPGVPISTDHSLGPQVCSSPLPARGPSGTGAPRDLRIPVFLPRGRRGRSEWGLCLLHSTESHTPRPASTSAECGRIGHHVGTSTGCLMGKMRSVPHV